MSLSYSFTVSDQLGNTRVVVDEQGEVQQKNEYTAFGVVQSTGPSKNKYLFNNKELQTGTNYLDYGARMYQPELGRWNVVDPLAEQRNWLSPYNYVQNNPVLKIDPVGMLDDNYTINQNGKVDREITADKTDNFKYKDNKGNVTDLGTFNKLDNGLIQIPKEAEVFTNNSNQTVPGKDRNYVDPKIFAGILGAAFEYKNESGLTMQINQLNDKNGGHSGHEGTGGFADIRYSNTKGDVNESVWTSGNNFDLKNSQILANKFTKFGFNQPGGLSILTENAKGNGPALQNTRFVDGKGVFHHKHHMHLQKYNFITINILK